LILLLVTADFLASPYCLGVEVEKALTRLKLGELKVVPILIRPCLWEESLFSELQIIPRDAKPVTQWESIDEALKNVANEIREIVSDPAPAPATQTTDRRSPHRLEQSLDLVRRQIRSYARSYEEIRQRMKPSHQRTKRMEEIAGEMRALATASYPLLDELASSPFPGEKLAAVSILQVFGAEEYLPFLASLIGSEKPFLEYHSIKALRFAVGSLDPQAYEQLKQTIEDATTALNSASVGERTDRHRLLKESKEQLKIKIDSFSKSSENND
jgi:hypothetical protein